MKILKTVIGKSKKLNFLHFIIFNIIIFGLVIVMNSMTRFENQIFSCSFWLTCENNGSLSNGFSLISQLILSSLGLLALLTATKFYSNKPENKYDYKFIVITLILASLVFLVNLYSILFQPAHPLIPTFISMSLTIVFTTWFVRRKNLQHIPEKLPGKNNLRTLLIISS